MRMRSLAFFSFFASLGLVVIAPADARACGGCFHEALTGSETTSVITDHRMVLSINADTTTLWDQVEYSGDPGGFSWVLPIRGRVVVAAANDKFISALDSSTQVTVQAPQRYCNNFAVSSSSGGFGCGSASNAGSADKSYGGTDPTGWQGDSGVYVTERSTVGPYEEVQIHGTTGDAIVTWLRANSYVVPDALVPMLKQYELEGFDFLALRLRPTTGVQVMQPIRVSWLGKTPQLPLRMVAAGVGSHVGIKLFVVADGRWTTQNFASFTVDPATLTWDWAKSRSDYEHLRDVQAASLHGHAFEMESSLDLDGNKIDSLVTSPYPTFDAGGLGDDSGGGADATSTTSASDGATSASEAAASDGGATDASSASSEASSGGTDASSASADATSDASEAGDDGGGVTSDAATDDSATDAATTASDAGTTAADVGTDASSSPGGDAGTAASDAAGADAPAPYDAGPAPPVTSDMTDTQVAFGGYGMLGLRRVTRLRADLPSTYLDQDLVLQADLSQATVSNVYQAQKDVNFSAVCPNNAANTQSQATSGCSCEVPAGETDRPLRGAIWGLSAIGFGAIVRRLLRRGKR